MSMPGLPALLRSGWFGAGYLLRHLPLGQAPPLIRGLVLSNRCNLRCLHCRVDERGAMDMSFAQSAAAIDAFYREGGRCLYLEGGEPFLWHDGPHGMDDVVDHAHGRGFLTVVVYTIGTLPIHTRADTVFVSVDGLRQTHNALRGRSFDRIMANIQASEHPSLFINYTINRRNRDEIRPFCEHADRIPQVRGTFFYFHTPYYGYDELYLDPDQRRSVLLELLDLRKKHRILNSRAGLLSALRNDWKRPMTICSVYENGRIFKCCRFAGDPELCRNCAT